MPTVAQLSGFQSSGLTCLEVAMACGPPADLALAALPALVSYHLIWGPDEARPMGVSLRITPATFRGASALTELSLAGHAGLELTPWCLGALTRLIELSVANCDLTAFPATLLGQNGRLRYLSLRGNRGLQLEPGCFRSLSGLTTLDLSR